MLFTVAPWSYETIHPESFTRRRLLRRLLGTPGGASEPLGLLCLSAYLKEKSHTVALADGAILTEEEILSKVENFKPDIVGLSTMKHNWDATRSLASKIKDKFAVPIVLGGPLVAGWKSDTLSECDAIDFAIDGEGELTTGELLSALENSRPLDSIPGLIWRRGSEVVSNPARKRIKDLDSLPFPDYALIDLRRYRPSIGFYRALPSANMMTTRGCPHNCTFCVSDRKLTMMSPARVIELTTYLIERFAVRHLTFYDESFTVKRSRAEEICELLLSRNIHIPWCANARVDEVDEKLLRLMKRAGCWKLLYGLESGVQKNLDTLNKHITLDQSRRAIELTKKCGIETFATFMFGIPGETFEEALKTIEFACELPLDYAAFLNLVPYKGTKIYEELDLHGRLTGLWSTNLISFVPHSMTLQQMVKLNQIANRRFYRRPGYLLRRLLSIRSFHDIRRNAIGFFSYAQPRRKDWEKIIPAPEDLA